MENLLRKRTRMKRVSLSVVSDESIMFETKGRKYHPDIVYIKDGKFAFTDINID